MKVGGVSSVGFLLILLLGVSSSFAQSEYEDVVYLKDGGVRRGLIIEQIHNESVKLKTAYGEIFVIQMSDISKIAKEEKKVPVPESVANTDNAPRGMSDVKLESWYTYWGLGYADMSYTDDLKDAQECSDCDTFSFGFDFLGFYWPLKNKQTIVGLVLNVSAESARNIFWTETSVSHQLSASVMHFFVSAIGKGPFARADLGVGGFETEIKGSIIPGTIEKYPGAGDEAGPALLLGVGYGIPVGSGDTRILTTLSIAFRPGPQGIDQDTGERHPKGGVTVVGLTVGGMF